MEEERETVQSIAIVNLILGAWLIISPWILGYTSAAAQWDQTIIGIVVVILAVLRGLAPRQQWLSFLTGLVAIWAVIAPFILGYDRSVTAARLNCCVRHGNRCFPSAMDTNQAFVPPSLLTSQTGYTGRLLANRDVSHARFLAQRTSQYASLENSLLPYASSKYKTLDSIHFLIFNST